MTVLKESATSYMLPGARNDYNLEKNMNRT